MANIFQQISNARLRKYKSPIPEQDLQTLINQSQNRAKVGNTPSQWGQAAKRVVSGAWNQISRGPKRMVTGLSNSIDAGLSARRLPTQIKSTMYQNDAIMSRAARLRQSGDLAGARKLLSTMDVQQRGNLSKIPVLQKQYNKGVLDTYTGLGETGLTAGGLISGAGVAPYLLSGTLGGASAALTGEDVATGIGKGLGSAPRYIGLNKLTGPLFDPLMNKAGISQNKLIRTAGKALMGGGTNVAEDELYSRFIEGKAPTAGDRLTSFGVGAALGSIYKTNVGGVVYDKKINGYRDIKTGQTVKGKIEFKGKNEIRIDDGKTKMRFIKDPNRANGFIRHPADLKEWFKNVGDEWGYQQAKEDAKNIKKFLKRLGPPEGSDSQKGAIDLGLFGKKEETPDMDTYKKSFAKFIGGKDVAKTVGTEQALKLELQNIDPTIEKQLIDYREGVTTKASPEVQNWAKKIDDAYDTKFKELKSVADEMGIDVGQRAEYSPHEWNNPNLEVDQVYQKAIGGTGITKKRIFKSEKDAIEFAKSVGIDLQPKYNTQAEKFESYVTKIEQLKNNFQFLEGLKGKVLYNGNDLVDIGRKNKVRAKDLPGYSQVIAPGITSPKEVLYAPNKIASEINRVFSPAEFGKFEKTLGKVAAFSKAFQELGLSGGAPGTPVNAFTAGQMIKSITGLEPRRTIKSFVLAAQPEKARAYFAQPDNINVIKELQSRNAHITTELRMENYVQKPKAEKMFGKTIGDAWQKLMNDPTFQRFMPIEQIEAYKAIKSQAIKRGLGNEEAADVATKAVKNFWGMVDSDKQVTRSKVLDDAMSTIFFAPKFRESMINFWLNNIKALKNPLALENIGNTKYLVGTALSLIGMNMANKALTGKYMFQNPAGKETTLLIPIDDKTTIGLPWAPSVGTIPRMAISSANYLRKGDTKKASLELRKSLSMMLRPFADLKANENYFGKEIYSETDTPKEKLQKQGEYLFKSLNHPWVKQVVEMYTKPDTPLYQRISMAMEMPIRYYNTQSLKNSEFWDKYHDLKTINERYEKLRYEDPKQAIQLLKDNEEKINEFNLMKGYVSEYFKQEEAGQVPTALQDYTAQKAPDLSGQSTDLISTRISLGDETLTPQEISKYYLRDITPNPVGEYAKKKAEKDIYLRLSQMENNDGITQQTKDKAIDILVKKIGITRDDYDYYKIAKEDNDLKVAHVMDTVNSGNIKNRADFLQYLASGRKEINNKLLVSDGVVTELKNLGLISASEAKQLKAFTYTEKDGKKYPKVKVSGRGNGATLKKIKLGDIPSQKVATFKQPSLGKIKVSDTKTSRAYNVPTDLVNLKTDQYSNKAKQAVARINPNPQFNL